jgi:hypothetical protein
MRPRLALHLCLIAALWLGCGEALSAEPAAPGWQAVLVAGDNAQPVFDNAVNALARWLGSQGVPSSDIHRLSAAQRPSDPTIEPASAAHILARIATMEPRSGDRCLIFISSHGSRGEGVWLGYHQEFLQPNDLAQALSVGCRAAPTVVIVSSCYSGAFVGSAMRAPNRIILSAARADRPSFGCQADRTYTVFDECLLVALKRAPTWRAVSAASFGCVRARERRLQVLSSQPQASFGAAVRDLAVR